MKAVNAPRLMNDVDVDSGSFSPSRPGVLADGWRSGELRLAGAAADLGRGFVALEDGFGILVLTGAETPESVERRLLEHARCVAGL